MATRDTLASHLSNQLCGSIITFTHQCHHLLACWFYRLQPDSAETWLNVRRQQVVTHLISFQLTCYMWSLLRDRWHEWKLQIWTETDGLMITVVSHPVFIQLNSPLVQLSVTYICFMEPLPVSNLQYTSVVTQVLFHPQVSKILDTQYLGSIPQCSHVTPLVLIL